MPTELLSSLSISSAFTVAFLLTGDTLSAENALLQSIELLPSGVVDSEQLTSCTVRLLAGAFRQKQHRDRIHDPTGGWPELPPELLSVLKLKPVLRVCFVLRILLNLPSAECAQLAQLDEHLMTSYVREALRQLAGTSIDLSSSFSILDRSLQKCAS